MLPFERRRAEPTAAAKLSGCERHSQTVRAVPPSSENSTGPTEVYEVDAAGTPVWHLVTRTQTMYRAEPLTSVGAETVVP